jgi:acetyl-CoA carboxylase alpha subunit
MSRILKETIVRYIEELQAIPIDTLIENRYQKYRKIGSFLGGDQPPAKIAVPKVNQGA